MISESIHTLTAAGVSAAFFLFASFGLTVRAGNFRSVSLGVSFILGLFVGPIAAVVLAIMAIRNPPAAIVAAKGG